MVKDLNLGNIENDVEEKKRQDVIQAIELYLSIVFKELGINNHVKGQKEFKFSKLFSEKEFFKEENVEISLVLF